MSDTQVAILGAGLAGLNAARLLHRAGIGFALFEARDRPGGRILTVDATGAPAGQGFDLGPSWVWPQMQPAIAALIRDLGLPCFGQHSTGDILFERGPDAAPHRMPAPPQDPPSMRVTGGTGALVQALLRDLPGDRLHFGRPVTALRLGAGGVEVQTGTGSLGARHVIVALPPRLLAQSITLEPAPPPQDLARWRATATWMAPHAKILALYDRPFWRAAGLCGMAQSLAGPLGEIHDATTADGQAALFGFAGISAAHRTALGEAGLIRAAIAQFTRLFGPEAASPRAALIKDWARDPWTATPADSTPTGHPPAFAGPWVTGAWRGRLWMAGSETSASDPGYLAGAVTASQAAVAGCVAA